LKLIHIYNSSDAINIINYFQKEDRNTTKHVSSYIKIRDYELWCKLILCRYIY